MKLATTILVTCVAALMALGMVVLYSSSIGQARANYLVMQPIWCGLGIVGCVIAASIDYKHLRKISIPLFVFTLLLLALVLVPGIGQLKNGSRRWFIFHGVSFQPSELAKLSLIIALA